MDIFSNAALVTPTQLCCILYPDSGGRISYTSMYLVTHNEVQPQRNILNMQLSMLSDWL